MHMPVMASSLMAKLVVGLMSMMAELMAKLLMAMLVMAMAVMAPLTVMYGNMSCPAMHMAVMACSLIPKLIGMMAMLVMTEMMGMSVMATLLISMDGNMYNPGVLSCT